MKRQHLILVFLGVILHYCAVAQIGTKFSYDQFGLFRKSTTLIVLDDKESSYNRTLRKVIAEQWKITPYEFIRFSEVNALLPAEGYSMLFKSSRTVANFQKEHKQSHSDISLVMCNREQWSDFGGIDEIASIDLENIEDTATYVYKMPLLIGGMLQYLEYLQSSQIDMYNFDYPLHQSLTKDSPRLAKKELWIIKEDLPVDLQDSAAIRQAYMYPFKFVDKSQLKKAITTKNPKVAHLYFTPQFHQIVVFDIESRRICYWYEPIKYQTVTLKDIKRLTKKIER